MFKCRYKNPNSQKVFCIGLNKTGTTTVKKVFQELGYKVGNQRKAELLLNEWSKRDFNVLLNYCETAQAFQDAPFSFPFTFIPLHQRYPDAKFVLTTRDNAEQWYNSITRFHSKIWGVDDGNPPSEEQLAEAKYIYKGRALEANKLQFNSPENSPYDKDTLLQYYENHCYTVKEYFRHLPKSLIEINVSNKDDFAALCLFLGKEPKADNFPWLNKT